MNVSLMVELTPTPIGVITLRIIPIGVGVNSNIQRRVTKKIDLRKFAIFVNLVLIEEA